MQRLTLLSLGSINADFQVRVDEPAGSRETQLAHDLCRLSGGKASNTAYLGARFGHRSLLLGRVGDDELAEQALDPLRQAGVEVDNVGRAAGQSTGVSMIMVPPDGKKSIVLATNANDCWDDAAIEAMAAAIDGCATPACLVLDYEVPARVVSRALEVAARNKIPAVLDPSFPERLDQALLPTLQAITPNVSEAEGLVGHALDSLDKLADAARQLQRDGPALVCIKLGDGGCVLTTADQTLHIPPGDVEPVDTTGAGDAFTGVFSVALLEGLEPREAAAWGVAAANLAVTGYGSQPAYADRQQVIELAQKLLEKARRLDG
ncbi:PfkB family carbohydrate kinase [Stutzerimonas zhaodongensis]|uniref:Bifunctional hydroxymethylpyrimidine kinase/phosphomethylpyrimidine kinase n=1 Tax=Stutzerimonas zhaodongensis TaxID=1176257 RepID=A0A365PQ06_9GAMM|nr:PfkB family carbohydrate kinase [Stutzerimonas zhaodongensis]QWV17563.1 bifunctional hydroxymethylpyrimidine kinase/phosphomethylpyrimidine kinase [Stutzerimonas zhaodongensis]RBA51978.1 ribokinase [Stutzerimonas zhaodongensis]